MKDQGLFEAIQQMVNSKKDPSQVQGSFAEKYCQQQLLRKRLVGVAKHTKMAHLMKRFDALETYINLPEMLKNIKGFKASAPVLKKTVEIQPEGRLEKQKFTRYFNDVKKINYIQENEPTRRLLAQIETQKQCNTSSFSNNAATNAGWLIETIAEQKEAYSSESKNKVFEMFHRFQEDGVGFELREKGQLPEYKDSKLNCETKKEYYRFLHKASSYLQIILETKHKKKWECKKKENKPQRKATPLIKRQTSINPVSKHQSFSTGNKIKDSFTFRRRDIKQKIVTKINNFLQEIDDQEYSSKQENEYYQAEINNLSKQYSYIYDRYERSVLIDKKDLNKIKTIAGHPLLKQDEEDVSLADP